MNVAEKIDDVLAEISSLLKNKNEDYGNSALDPIRVFATGMDAKAQLLVRIDDKLSRIQQGNTNFKEDTILDLIGYLVLLRISLREL